MAFFSRELKFHSIEFVHEFQFAKRESGKIGKEFILANFRYTKPYSFGFEHSISLLPVLNSSSKKILPLRAPCISNSIRFDRVSKVLPRWLG
ncbi:MULTISPECIES: hypothetical protein [Leptospira]|uniref:Uncharacterized protein n=2 Tax=Leptospira borgpetersenii TaxID=174 RepID=A0AAV3JL02_LEPBO|nr:MULTISPECIES: hypothetical protein [Leptospira]EMO09351.1 hypothetical protein LEP1GSC137_2032 [Leptospira borgpetersenii str. Noumea 25]AXX15455.1 hypothetical protein C4Q31_07775 [Leptospira borgpetersenii serovar Ceylonica]EKQ91296.1 hypothetical protein LEP1GSC101_1526 [Leptospira borgpetersenii str. UI 09149]EKR02242.1 hypothetical protein LEP1GSC121_0916 [Leptospira borgpetersenii serovar Castellonis str. 200801910]EMK11437.1 hypothetical protein LEP1GSC066_1742 [Leptospira sp. serova